MMGGGGVSANVVGVDGQDGELVVLDRTATTATKVFDAAAYRRLTESFFDPRLFISFMGAKGVDELTLLDGISLWQSILPSMHMSNKYRTLYLTRLSKTAIIIRTDLRAHT